MGYDIVMWNLELPGESRGLPLTKEKIIKYYTFQDEILEIIVRRWRDLFAADADA